MAANVQISPYSSLNFDHSKEPMENGRFLYTQAFLSSDTIRVQVLVRSGGALQFMLVDHSGGVDQILYPTIHTTENGKIHSVLMPNSLGVGSYELQIYHREEIFANSHFCIIGEDCAKNTRKIRYTNNTDEASTVFLSGTGNIFFDYRVEAEFLANGISPQVGENG